MTSVGPTQFNILIDTGAEISICKVGKLFKNLPIDNRQRCKFSGITQGYTYSLGKITAHLNLCDGYSVTHDFQVVKDDFPLPVDAILGEDFLKSFNCSIDYFKSQLLIRTRDKIFKVSFSQASHDPYQIPPRCQVFRKIPLEITSDSVVHSAQIGEGLFVANTLISPTSKYIRVINTTDDYQKLDINKVEFSPLTDYVIIDEIKAPDKNRKQKVLDLISKNTGKSCLNEFLKLSEHYTDIFALPDEKLSVNNFYKQNIRLNDNTPIYKRNYRVPHTHKPIIEEKIKQMLDDEIIEPSQSPYNSPILLVPKKSVDGKPNWRLVIDYRELNKKVIPDKFPLPRIDEILDELGRAKHFSILDLQSGFHQIELDEKSRDFTSFSTEQGSFRFTRVPFGLNISPNAFSRMMRLAFAGLPPQTAFLYMDDIIVIGCSVKHHISNLKKVFDTCKKFSLKLNPEKCKFFQTSVTFLGHKCTENGILPDPEKYETIKNYPVPKNSDEARRFVAFANYYRKFIEHFATITKPINDLTRKKTPFVWTEECQKNFELLKNRLMNPPILKYPNFNAPFIITTDASGTGCAAVLSQKYGDLDLPVSYFSKNFTQGERNKAPIEQELLAIYYAIMHFRPYIYGTQFTVKSDHKPLVYLFTLKNPSSRLTRIRLELEEYMFEIIHIPGKENVVADALSRIDIEQLKQMHLEVKKIAAITRAQAKANSAIKESLTSEDQPNLNRPRITESISNAEISYMHMIEFDFYDNFCYITRRNKIKLQIDLNSYLCNQKLNLTKLLKNIENFLNENKITELAIYKNDQIFKYYDFTVLKKIVEETFEKVYLILAQPITIVQDPEEKQKLIKLYHNDPILGGHCGRKRLFAKLFSRYRWKGMSNDIIKYVSTCKQCQLNKAGFKNKPHTIITPTPEAPFDVILLDLVGPFTISDSRNKYAITLQCNLTKYVVIIPIPDKEALTVAQALINDFFLIYGPIKHIRTDNGSEFINEIFRNLNQLLEINHQISTPYHPQTIAPLERNHKVLNSYLKMYINNSQSDWDVFAKYYALHWNISPISQLNNYSPFELVFNRKPNFPNILFKSVEPVYNSEDFVKTTKYRFQHSNTQAKAWLEQVKIKQKEDLDSKAKSIDFQIGDTVKINRPSRKKLEPFYDGPYVIENIEYPNVIIHKPHGKKPIKIHLDRVTPFYM